MIARRVVMPRAVAAIVAPAIFVACGGDDASAPAADGAPADGAAHVDGAAAQADGSQAPDADPGEDIVYEVGERGPAGGLIFYVDTEDSYDDFDYLEAAPVESEVASVSWQENPSYVSGTDQSPGSGAENTQAILDVSEGEPSAAIAADELEVGGYDDWFLPSLKELEGMRIVLHEEGLGDFADDAYWTSTAQGGAGGPYYALVEDFDPEGDLATSPVADEHRVRAARAGTISED